MASKTGRCLCGAVSFTAEDVEMGFGACHCEMCRRWSGGTYIATQVGAMTIEGEENITRYQSSPWAERAFCAKCGTNLYYRVTAPGQHYGQYHVAVGGLDDLEGMTLASEIFIDKKPAAYEGSGAVTKMTEAEVFAMFAGEDASNG
ncbi:MAG: GFA family protein [Pseudomonadota bacterium]